MNNEHVFSSQDVRVSANALALGEELNRIEHKPGQTPIYHFHPSERSLETGGIANLPSVGDPIAFQEAIHSLNSLTSAAKRSQQKEMLEQDLLRVMPLAQKASELGNEQLYSDLIEAYNQGSLQQIGVVYANALDFLEAQERRQRLLNL